MATLIWTKTEKGWDCGEFTIKSRGDRYFDLFRVGHEDLPINGKRASVTALKELAEQTAVELAEQDTVMEMEPAPEYEPTSVGYEVVGEPITAEPVRSIPEGMTDTLLVTFCRDDVTPAEFRKILVRAPQGAESAEIDDFVIAQSGLFAETETVRDWLGMNPAFHILSYHPVADGVAGDNPDEPEPEVVLGPIPVLSAESRTKKPTELETLRQEAESMADAQPPRRIIRLDFLNDGDYFQVPGEGGQRGQLLAKNDSECKVRFADNGKWKTQGWSGGTEVRRILPFDPSQLDPAGDNVGVSEPSPSPETEETEMQVSETAARELLVAMGKPAKDWDVTRLGVKLNNSKYMLECGEGQLEGDNLQLYRTVMAVLQDGKKVTIGDAPAKASGKKSAKAKGVAKAKKPAKATAEASENGHADKPAKTKAAKKKPSGDGERTRNSETMDLVHKILIKAKKPLNKHELVEAMVKAGWSKPGGKTPEDTIKARIYVDMKTNGDKSRFQKAERGQFTVRA